MPAARAHAAVFDLGRAEGCAGLVAQFPEVDILVNNLGIYEPKAFFDIEDDDWTRMFDVNVMSGVRLTRHYLKRMLDARDWGRVVFVSSKSAIFVPKEMVHYGFSKAAQLYIARGAAEQTKGTNITVNSVLPGPTWVEMAPVRLAARAKGLGTTADELAAKTFTERRPASLLQRYATPEEVANLICYVCSKAASATNGAALACRWRHRHQSVLSALFPLWERVDANAQASRRAGEGLAQRRACPRMETASCGRSAPPSPTREEGRKSCRFLEFKYHKGIYTRILAARYARGVRQFHPSRKKRGAGKAGRRLHPRSCAQNARVDHR